MEVWRKRIATCELFEVVGRGYLKSEGQVLIPDVDGCGSQGLVH